MREYVFFVCLANSRKMRGRCIAGIDILKRSWIRPVKQESVLEDHNIMYKDKSVPAVLDIVGIYIKNKKPLYYQPENYIIDIDTKTFWDKIGRFPKQKISEYCNYYDDYIFADTKDFLTCTEIKDLNLKHSLMLIKPQQLMFEKKVRYGGGEQIRAWLKYNSKSYNLVVTDDKWEGRFIGKECGFYRVNARNYYLTISLGGCFGGYHYKLVAAVI